MAEHTIVVPMDDYNQLVRKAERIDAVERISTKSFVTIKDILLVLGIEKAVENGEV